jgi:hypothetical protein
MLSFLSCAGPCLEYEGYFFCPKTAPATPPTTAAVATAPIVKEIPAVSGAATTATVVPISAPLPALVAKILDKRPFLLSIGVSPLKEVVMFFDPALYRALFILCQQIFDFFTHDIDNKR